MAAYATASDVAARWGKAVADLDPEIVALIEVRLGDVERMIKRRIKDLDAQIDADKVDVEDVKQVESDAVLRLARNPEGYMSESDGNYTYMLRSDLSSGKLEILADEWETLGVSASGMFVIVPILQRKS
ncbi:Phage protein Gp19/Gp15/Gp42 [Mycobacteroides abscessus subsp. abscessus]|uniref:Gp19/Gp15/Gp42 family protein n=1 Tax=Mycobacteroides abscessus TaxID=36809 RepID=UPI00092B239D|nr:Gp19/Gp15/Gp42 family protein [Mycobacteroides abscessus]SHS98080.1 Phage protein Gp19/Gp15/Gp42 [Mycobacteroides abscessus subsp. abscessus]SLK64977.1 Phage protein Gp19/Gp15/Gp42 [Mycobacteroides abscessus subsp. abscessus]